MNRIILSCFIVILLPIAARAETPLALSPKTLFQGDAVVVSFSKNPRSATFDGAAISVFPYAGAYRAVFGVSATKPPGAYVLRVDFADGTVQEQTVAVRAKKFPLVVLGIPEKLGLTPTGLVNKLQTEKVILDEIFGKKAENVFFSSQFGLALADNRRVGSVFGEIRQTGETQIRHMGTDFTAKKGAAVGAIIAGLVRKAYVDAVYGNLGIVDQGQGIFSSYTRLGTIRVKEGAALKKGSLVGTVGNTGYAETPHLHLSIKINGVSVDPISFVRNLQ